jgi:hypothetical protein
MAQLAPHDTHVTVALVTSMLNSSPSDPPSMFPSM